MGVSENIYKIMEFKKMKQSAVAKAANMDPKEFNSILRRRKLLREEHIIPICMALEITPNELFGTANMGKVDPNKTA